MDNDIISKTSKEKIEEKYETISNNVIESINKLEKKDKKEDEMER